MFDLIPFERNERSLFNFLDNFEKSFLGSTAMPQFRTDILDKGDHYELQAELPGFQKEDIKIDVSGDTLTVSTEHKEESEDKQENYVRRERRYGSFARSFDISGIDPSKIDAAYTDGVLKLSLPKQSEEAPASHRIEVK